MKRKKSYYLLTLLLSTVLCISSNIEAATGPGAKNGDVSVYISPEQQLQMYLNDSNNSQSDKQAYLKQYNYNRNFLKSKLRLRNSDNLVLTVPWYSQDKDYYCGPATMQQTLMYLNRTSPSQDQLASALGTNDTNGTDTYKMCNYLNAHTNFKYEVLWKWADANVFSQMVTKNTNMAKPIIGHIIVKTKHVGDPISEHRWPYVTDGHYINYNGYSEGGKLFAVTDPYADRKGISNGKYYVWNTSAESVTDRIIW